jgi:polysaccharide biosynthesis/export protein
MILSRTVLIVLGCAVASLSGGCALVHRPANNPPELYDKERTNRTRVGQGFAPESAAAPLGGGSLKDNLSFVNEACPPAGTAEYMDPGSSARHNSVSHADLTMRYSTGDRFNVQVPGAAEFSGDFVVNADGRVILPFAGEVPVRGVTNAELTTSIERALVSAKLFEAKGFRIAVRPVLYAPINITVSGAVFSRGRHTINADGNALDPKATTKTGDSPLGRFVVAGLQSANGVRPDADLSRIELRRNGKVYYLNWRGALTGEPVDDVPLIDGDHIHVPESSCFQSALVRPSQITPVGVRVFMSNLTAPAFHNAASAITKDSSSLPYGTRFLAGLVADNCVGGAVTSNAGRYAVLITRNPKTMETEVIQRSIEELVLSPDRDTINPYLMPDDAIACYDSVVTNVREVGTTASTILSPIQILQNILTTSTTTTTSK